MLNGMVLSKDYGRERPDEEGGSADLLSDNSSHRCILLLPSDINGPPIFQNFGQTVATLINHIPARV
jgi:hypothetical protein